MAVLMSEDLAGVRLLTLNRPDARNALSVDLVHELYAALEAADEDEAVRAVVLTGADPAFCAGIDLKAVASDGAAYIALLERVDCIGRVALMGVPVIGAINGATFTGGLEVALGCDFLVASERAVFADTHARVGVLPFGGMTARLPQVVGVAQARRMSMTGEVIDARRAERIGLVTEVVAHEQLLPRALELAGQVAEVPRGTMRALKEIYTEGFAATAGAALGVELRLAKATAPAYGELEANRVAVLARNRGQLTRGT